MKIAAICLVGCLLAGCEEGAREKARVEPAEVPASLRPLGEGFPVKGSPCRHLGETPATSNYLDHTAMLIGCPGTRESAVVQSVVAKGGRIVAEIDGVVLISVPTGGQTP